MVIWILWLGCWFGCSEIWAEIEQKQHRNIALKVRRSILPETSPLCHPHDTERLRKHWILPDAWEGPDTDVQQEYPPSLFLKPLVLFLHLGKSYIWESLGRAETLSISSVDICPNSWEGLESRTASWCNFRAALTLNAPLIRRLFLQFKMCFIVRKHKYECKVFMLPITKFTKQENCVHALAFQSYCPEHILTRSSFPTYPPSPGC